MQCCYCFLPYRRWLIQIGHTAVEFIPVSWEDRKRRENEMGLRGDGHSTASARQSLWYVIEAALRISSKLYEKGMGHCWTRRWCICFIPKSQRERGVSMCKRGGKECKWHYVPFIVSYFYIMLERKHASCTKHVMFMQSLYQPVLLKMTNIRELCDIEPRRLVQQRRPAVEDGRKKHGEKRNGSARWRMECGKQRAGTMICLYCSRGRLLRYNSIGCPERIQRCTICFHFSLRLINIHLRLSKLLKQLVIRCMFSERRKAANEDEQLEYRIFRLFLSLFCGHQYAFGEPDTWSLNDYGENGPHHRPSASGYERAIHQSKAVRPVR